MRCPTCGFENPKSYGPCARCGRFLSAFSMQTPKPADSAAKKPAIDFSRDISYAGRSKEEFSHEDVSRRMKMDYQHGTRDSNQRTLEIILKLLESSRRRVFDVNGLIQEAANLIRDQYRLRWVAIGLKDTKDGMFRYDALLGFREDALQARRKQAFKVEDFTGDSKYRGRMISDYSKMYFEEDMPFTDGAESTFNRPALLKSKRRASDDALEADYLDVHIYGPDRELLGWIETSGTIMGKLPDIPTIKAIEVFASIIGATIVRGRRPATSSPSRNSSCWTSLAVRVRCDPLIAEDLSHLRDCLSTLRR